MRRALGRGLAIALSVVAFLGARALELGDRRTTWPPLDAEERARVTEALVAFQRAYEDFYASGGAPAMLDAFPATKPVKHLVFRDLGYLKDVGLVMVQDLATATLDRIERTGRDTAEAWVFEEWNYGLQRVDDRRPITRVRGLGQGFRYRLVRSGGRWLVDAWDPVELAPPKDAGAFKW